MAKRSLRSHLLELTLCGTVPLALIASVLIFALLSTPSGYTVFTAPGSPSDAAIARTLVWLVALSIVAVFLSLAFARAKERKIASLLNVVEERAAHMADQDALDTLPSSNVVEIDRAVLALDEARGACAAALKREQDARAECDAAHRAKDQFLAILGHELRNPLNVIVSSAEAIRRTGATTATQEAALERLLRQTEYLSRIVDEDFTRAITKRIELTKRVLDLGDVVGQVLSALQAAGQLASHRIETRLENVEVDADEVRLAQVVTNLAVNAARYSPPSAPIKVTVAKEGGRAVLRIADEGVGIAQHMIDRIFDLFVQVDDGHRSHGLGVGLAIVKRLVELHGGTVVAASDGPGRGSTFTVTLPLHVAAPQSSDATGRAAA